MLEGLDVLSSQGIEVGSFDSLREKALEVSSFYGVARGLRYVALVFCAKHKWELDP